MNVFLFYLEDEPAELKLFQMRYQQVVKKALGHEGRLLTATSGEQAIEVIKNANPKPGVFVLDLNMPGKIKGKDVLRWLNNIKELDPCAKIVLTTSTNEQDRTDCYEIGCDAYYIKPKSAIETKALIRSILTDYKDREPSVNPTDSLAQLTEKVKGLIKGLD